ncbi:MAG: hypothetical protein IGS48_11690 [Oscillatoriales cyanobacterium C42_A2020_001]|nr:hypothetical protein [Leptolyngbyaceae cyanobacterium C42_A2020_001]
MSEFSDCYYLVDATSDDAIALAKKARRYSLIFPKTGRYVPFLVDGAWNAGQCIDVVIENNPGILLHYSYTADYGLWLNIYERSNKSCTIEIQRRSPSENDWHRILSELERLNLIGASQVPELQTIFENVSKESIVDLSNIRNRLGEILGVPFLKWFGCADLSIQPQKDLAQCFSEATFVLKSLRGKADKEIEPVPNEWCPHPGLPAFMYLPVPDGQVDETLLERHVRHWQKTNDWDDASHAGFWVYTGYCKALPSRMRYLANRIMNLEKAFGHERYEAELRRTIRGILATTDPTFDWEPYLNRKAGEQRL